MRNFVLAVLACSLIIGVGILILSPAQTPVAAPNSAPQNPPSVAHAPEAPARAEAPSATAAPTAKAAVEGDAADISAETRPVAAPTRPLDERIARALERPEDAYAIGSIQSPQALAARLKAMGLPVSDDPELLARLERVIETSHKRLSKLSEELRDRVEAIADVMDLSGEALSLETGETAGMPDRKMQRPFISFVRVGVDDGRQRQYFIGVEKHPEYFEYSEAGHRVIAETLLVEAFAALAEGDLK